MADESPEVNALLENILSQPETLRALGAYHRGPGGASLTASATVLASAKRVVISGMGASLFAASPFSYWLSARGQPVLTVESSELLYFLEAQIDDRTVLLLVSRSGESVEVLKLLRRAKEKGARVIGLSNVPESTLNREADHAILMSSAPDQLVAIQSYVATLATFSLLQAAIESQVDLAASELEETASVLDPWIPECVEGRESWDRFLDTRTPLYLLGRGPSNSSVAEGVLLMHEIAKAPAVGMTIAQFRHGPVEVVAAEFRAIVFGTQPATASLDRTFAEDLTGMGGQIRWIGPALPEVDIDYVSTWPAPLPLRFTGIAEIIPVQIAAYRKAELKSIKPGDFRWAPAITTSETGFHRQG